MNKAEMTVTGELLRRAALRDLGEAADMLCQTLGLEENEQAKILVQATLEGAERKGRNVGGTALVIVEDTLHAVRQKLERGEEPYDLIRQTHEYAVARRKLEGLDSMGTIQGGADDA